MISKATFLCSRDTISILYKISSLLVLVTMIQSAIGVIFPQVFRDPAMTVGNARGTDVVILFTALPVMVISMVFARRGSLRAQLVWAGVLIYLFYNAVIFTFAMVFNSLFLFYLATLSLSGWSLLILISQMDIELIHARFIETTPVRCFAGYLAAISLLFLLTWMKQIVPALFSSTTPEFLSGTIMLTSPVHVLDLGFLLPSGFLGAVWLWRKQTWGYTLTGMLLVMITIETLSIAVDQYFGHLHDPAASPAAILPFFGMFLIGLVISVTYIRFIKQKSNLVEG
jgi:hypothetical protein